jgi:adenylate cyclase
MTERILNLNERPADIIKLRMKQAGYDADDGAHLLGIESLSILLKFVYKSQLLAGVRFFLRFLTSLSSTHFDFPG